MDTFVHLLTDWGYIGMFIAAFWAGTILPFCSEAVLLACIGLGLDPVLSILFTTAGNSLGGITCYWMAFFSFVPIIGGPILVALGLMKAPVPSVAVSMTLGKLLRYIILVAATLGIIHTTL